MYVGHPGDPPADPGSRRFQAQAGHRRPHLPVVALIADQVDPHRDLPGGVTIGARHRDQAEIGPGQRLFE